jgi:hypothetical protein
VYRVVAFAVPVFLVVLAGCAPAKSDIDKSIKDEMKTSMNVEITSTNLTKQSDGGYTGTATAANGDVYDVTVDPPKGGRTEWKAIPSQAMVEKMMREGIATQIKSNVKTLTLTKQGPGIYSGTADLENGLKMKVSTSMEGKNMNWKAEPMQ